MKSFLFLFIAVLYFFLLPLGDVFQVSEGREGVVINAMLQNGEYVLPLRHGEIVPSKPILFHWIAGLSNKLFGFRGELLLRFPSYLAALGILLVLAAALYRAVGELEAVIGVAILGSMYGFTRLAADGRVDMVFTFFTSAALFLWCSKSLPLVEKRLSWGKQDFQLLDFYPKRTLVLFSTLCGFACLAKGPLGFVLPLLIVVGLTFWTVGLSGVKKLLRPEWLICPVIAAPWYIFAALKAPDAFVSRHLFFENLRRFTGGEGITARPIWFYFEHIWTQSAPWLVLALVMMILVLRKHGSWRELVPKENRALLVVFSIWIIVAFLFLSAATGKRRAYLLFLLPPLAGALALLLPYWWRQFQERNLLRLFQGLWLLLALLMLTILSLPHCLEYIDFSREMNDAIKAILANKEFYSVGAALLCLLSFPLVLQRSVRSSRVFVQLILALCFVNIFIIKGGLIIKGHTHGYRDFAGVVNSIVPPTAKLTFIKKKSDESFDGLFFYLDREVLLGEKLGPGYYLARAEWFKNNSNGQKVYATGGRLTDKDSERLVLFKSTLK